MCPIPGLVQCLIVPVILILLCRTIFVRSLKVEFIPNTTMLTMYDAAEINYVVSNLGPDKSSYMMYSENNEVASLTRDAIISAGDGNLSGTFNISGNFLGKTAIRIKNTQTNVSSDSEALDVIVVRKQRLIDVVFHASVAILVCVLYINFGCAIDWGELANILKKPVGPAIGFFGQFLIMPVLSYVLGLVLFADSPEMRLGLFFAGVSPGGGASNVWTVVLDGNMSLSIVMTAMSTVAAFFMMPLWIFTLGSLIFEEAKLDVPYRQITTYVIALVVPLAIGYLIQRYLKRVAGFMSKILKGFSTCLIVFIIVFAIISNLYLFKLFSWKIILAGMGLPWLGYILGYLTGHMMKQPHPDSLTIAIEVGVQNTGIAIFLLRFALPQPEADLTTIAPVSVAMLTPFPLMLLYFFGNKISKLCGYHAKLNTSDDVFKDDVNNVVKETGALNPT